MAEKKCPLCGERHIAVFMEGVYDCETTKVLECGACGLQFLDPMMSDEEEERYYKDYYEEQKTRHYNTMSLKELQQRALMHYEQYQNIYYELIKGRRDILEIGSGTGGFLRFIKEKAPRCAVVSVERSEANREFLKLDIARDFSDIVITDDLDALAPESAFDLVVAFGVLEHVKNGADFLKSLRGCLRDEQSLLALNIPNKNNPLVCFYNIDEFKKFTYMKQHYYTYTEESLQILAAQTGHVIEKFNYIQVWGLDNHLSWLKVKRPQDFSKYTGLLSEHTLTSYNQDLIKRKMTDLLMAVMKKSS